MSPRPIIHGRDHTFGATDPVYHAWEDVGTGSGGGGGGYVPPGPNFSVWYDFSDLTTITTDGSGNISAIADKSGNGYTASQATAARRPGQTFVNGLPAGLFNGSANSNLGHYLQTVLFTMPSPFTMFCVASQSAATDSTHFPKFFDLGAYFFQNGNFNQLSLQVGGGNIHSSLTAPYTQQLFAAVSDGSSSQIRLNGTLSTASGGSPSATPITDGVTLGHYLNGLNDSGHVDGLTGALCECIGFQGILTSGEIAANEAYLKTKWGTP